MLTNNVIQSDITLLEKARAFMLLHDGYSVLAKCELVIAVVFRKGGSPDPERKVQFCNVDLIIEIYSNVYRIVTKSSGMMTTCSPHVNASDMRFPYLRERMIEHYWDFEEDEDDRPSFAFASLENDELESFNVTTYLRILSSAKFEISERNVDKF